MKLRTIIFFGITGLLVSSPMLFSKFKERGRQFANEQVAPNVYGAAKKKTGGFLSGLFGRSEPGPVSQDNGSPFHFAGTSQSQGYPGHQPFSTAGGNGTNSPPMIYAPAITQSEMVYQPFTSFNEFIRFDISPAWVRQRWPRVSTLMGEDYLSGMRVALVSGPRPVDIHGSLTYYFDDRQQVQRITFKGWTGDATEIVQMVSQMGFKRQNSNGAAQFISTSWGKVKGVLRLDHPPVIQRVIPNEQLMILFEATNPKGSLAVSKLTSSILTAMQPSR